MLRPSNIFESTASYGVQRNMRNAFHRVNLCGRRDAPASTSGRECDSEAAQHDKWLVFEVADTGCGVAKEGLCSLFKEFVQASPLNPGQSHIILKSNEETIAPVVRANLRTPFHLVRATLTLAIA